MQSGKTCTIEEMFETDVQRVMNEYLQNLWDSGMAYSIYHHLKKNRSNKVFYILGHFHSDEKLGTMAKLLTC